MASYCAGVAFDVPDEETAVVFLNRILGESDAVPQLEREGLEWRFRYVGSLLDVLSASTASSLLEAIRVDGWERFGRCAGSPCCCVYVDRSRNRSRRRLKNQACTPEGVLSRTVSRLIVPSITAGLLSYLVDQSRAVFSSRQS